MGVENPLSPIRNTRQIYDKQLERVITEVQVKFADENPAWIPLETLLAICNMQGFSLTD
jgi:DNA-binding Xre family transcriptional regulator